MAWTLGEAAEAVRGVIVLRALAWPAGTHMLRQRSLSIALVLGEAAVTLLQQEAEQQADDPPARTWLAETISTRAAATTRKRGVFFMVSFLSFRGAFVSAPFTPYYAREEESPQEK
jgi:hypothetical protein